MLSPSQARIHTFEVVPHLPPPLQPLLEVAHNLWWSWHPEAVQLFKRIDRELWEESHHNPVQMLGMCPQDRLDELAKDDGLLTSLQRIEQGLRRHMERTPWLMRHGRHPGRFTIAYFCAEFGLTECLQIYSGGLGCLAGDHLKSASELGMPLVGVGLLYRHGYFQQYLNADGWQQEYYPDLDFANLPVAPVLDDRGQQVRVAVSMPGREVQIAVWKVRVGRIALYLLDTNLGENEPADREITGHLYGGDMDMRIRQELVLGIGGARALEAIGIQPDIYHMNEGHSAFLGLERIRRHIEKHDISFDEARQQASASNVFTTHTPVPAGIDRFPPEMIQRYFRDKVAAYRLDMEGLLALGRENVFARNEFFSMAVLAIRTSDWANGVSALHGDVSRDMWRGIWPGVPEPEVPILHVTNGVHARSWMSAGLIDLLDGYLGHRWQDDPADQTPWQSINEVPDEELWRIHEHYRRRLIIWTRRQLRQQLLARGADPAQVAAVADALDPNALTVGFARRFATYKRGNLLLRDVDRLRAMLHDAKRPIQFLVAGKAHPADSAGKDLIRQIVHFAREHERSRVVFIENYDINVARYLVQGCDVWLNTPRRGMEASGTSGMKAALNGVLNCSVLDGWWDEAAQPDIGWSIGQGESYTNPDEQDNIESRTLYDLFEKQIIPLFYERDETGLPRRWVARMKRCISVLAPMFNTNRMVQEYAEKLYLPALKRARSLAANNLTKSVELAHQKGRLRSNWSKLRVEDVKVENAAGRVDIGDELTFTLVAQLGELRPDEVRVQSYFGSVDNDGRITSAAVGDLQHVEDLGDGRHRFSGAITAQTSGRFGFAIRIVPGGELLEGIVEPGLIYWDSGAPAARKQVPTPVESAA